MAIDNRMQPVVRPHLCPNRGHRTFCSTMKIDFPTALEQTYLVAILKDVLVERQISRVSTREQIEISSSWRVEVLHRVSLSIEKCNFRNAIWNCLYCTEKHSNELLLMKNIFLRRPTHWTILNSLLRNPPRFPNRVMVIYQVFDAFYFYISDYCCSFYM